MTTLSYSQGLPTAGSTLNSIADPEIISALNQILTWANGNIDGINLSAAGAQSACVNQAGQTVKGATNISTSQSTSSTTYTTLATPDQVTGIVLPPNGLIRVWYQATWQESVSGAARAAIFIGSNQLVVAAAGVTGNGAQAAATGSGSASSATILTSCAVGLVSGKTDGYAGPATTGQAVGIVAGEPTSTDVSMDIGGAVLSANNVASYGGPCNVFAAAGTYTVSVQFKASSGSVTASNRKLWVQTISFS